MLLLQKASLIMQSYLMSIDFVTSSEFRDAPFNDTASNYFKAD